MDLTLISTAGLEKMLSKAAGGSAQHRAIQEELRARGSASRRTDRETQQLFTGAELEQMKPRK